MGPGSTEALRRIPPVQCATGAGLAQLPAAPRWQRAPRVPSHWARKHHCQVAHDTFAQQAARHLSSVLYSGRGTVPLQCVPLRKESKAVAGHQTSSNGCGCGSDEAPTAAASNANDATVRAIWTVCVEEELHSLAIAAESCTVQRVWTPGVGCRHAASLKLPYGGIDHPPALRSRLQPLARVLFMATTPFSA